MTTVSKDLKTADNLRARIVDKTGIKYSLSILMPPATNSIDTKGYKAQYGLFDQSGNAVEPLYQFSLTSLEGAESLRVLPFVAAQYSAMKRKFEELSSKRGSLYGHLTPVRATIRSDSSYDMHLSSVIGAFVDELYVQKRNSVHDFHQFCNEFIKFVKNTRTTQLSGGMPISKTLYIASGHTRINASGLVIEFQEDEYNDTFKNSIPWMQDKNFKLYCDAATKTGFMVDREYPFRLIADISSKHMQAAAEFYGADFYMPGTAATIFPTFYRRVSLYDYIPIKDKLLMAYNIFNTDGHTTILSECRGQVQKDRTPREHLHLENLVVPPIPGRPQKTLQEVLGPKANPSDVSWDVRYGLHSEKYDLLYFTRLYIMIRYYEIGYITKYLTLSDVDVIVKKARKLVLAGNLTVAFDYINEKFKSYRLVIH